MSRSKKSADQKTKKRKESSETQFENQNVQLTDPRQSSLYDDPDSYKWILVPNRQSHGFYIELDIPSFDNRPRLLSAKLPEKVWFNSQCIVTSKSEKGHGNLD